jgi:hypothetical protein
MSVDDESINEETKVIKLRSSKVDPEKQERVAIFELDDVEYTVPAKPSAGMALKYLKLQATSENPDYAQYWMMTRLLGEETYDVLAEHEDLDFEQMEEIIELCTTHLFGGQEGKEAAEKKLEAAKASASSTRSKKGSKK